MDTIIAALIGTLGTGFLALAAWAINRIFINPIDRQDGLVRQLMRDHTKQTDQIAVLRHALTQAIMRIEWLEEAHRDHPHRRKDDSRHIHIEDEGGI